VMILLPFCSPSFFFLRLAKRSGRAFGTQVPGDVVVTQVLARRVAG
jgi:hypothetical protein